MKRHSLDGQLSLPKYSQMGIYSLLIVAFTVDQPCNKDSSSTITLVSVIVPVSTMCYCFYDADHEYYGWQILQICVFP